MHELWRAHPQPTPRSSGRICLKIRISLPASLLPSLSLGVERAAVGEEQDVAAEEEEAAVTPTHNLCYGIRPEHHGEVCRGQRTGNSGAPNLCHPGNSTNTHTPDTLHPTKSTRPLRESDTLIMGIICQDCFCKFARNLFVFGFHLCNALFILALIDRWNTVSGPRVP